MRKRKKVGKYHPLTDQQRMDILHLHINEGKTATTIVALYKDKGVNVPLGTMAALFRKQARGEYIGHRAKRTRDETYTEAHKRLVCQTKDEHNDWSYEQLRQV